MDHVRLCTPEDIPAVADLFQRVFRQTNAPAPNSLKTYFMDTFFRHPWFDQDLVPRVYVSSGARIRGFIGVYPSRMVWKGQTVRAAIASSLMVDQPAEIPTAGARLLRSFMSGPQDLSIAETASPVTREMMTLLGGKPLTLNSMDWTRVLRPAGFAIALLRRRFRLAGLSGPPASAMDYLVGRTKRNPFRLNLEATASTNDIEADTKLFKYIPELASSYSLRPDWDEKTLEWLLTHARQKTQYGQFVGRAVYGKSGNLLGCYLYHGRPGDVARVLQVLAHRSKAGTVIDSMILHAYRQGAVAVSGRVQPETAEPLLFRKSILWHESATIVHARSPELMEAATMGGALVNGLAGEVWSRLIGDVFD